MPRASRTSHLTFGREHAGKELRDALMREAAGRVYWSHLSSCHGEAVALLVSGLCPSSWMGTSGSTRPDTLWCCRSVSPPIRPSSTPPGRSACELVVLGSDPESRSPNSFLDSCYRTAVSLFAGGCINICFPSCHLWRDQSLHHTRADIINTNSYRHVMFQGIQRWSTLCDSHAGVPRMQS